MTQTRKDIRLLIRGGDLPGGVTRMGAWRDPGAAHAELTRLLSAFLKAFPGASVEVTSHAGDTVLYVATGYDKRKAEYLCADYLAPRSRSQFSPAAPQLNAPVAAKERMEG